MTPVSGFQLAGEIGGRWHGSDRKITCVSALPAAGDGVLTFATTSGKVTHDGAIVIAANCIGSAGIVADNPRLAFIRALVRLGAHPRFESDDNAPSVAQDALIGDGTFLGRGVIIGAGTRIGSNVVISDGVHIGSGCIVKSGAVIGEEGFGYERDERGDPLRFPHLGRVVIGNHAEIGSRTTICRGTLADTVIGDYAKIDDSAHVAHNCRIGRGALIHAGVVLSGGVDIGSHAWIGPNAAVIQYVRIGERAQVGIGATVIGDVDSGATVVGNPAHVLYREGVRQKDL